MGLYNFIKLYSKNKENIYYILIDIPNYTRSNNSISII